MSESHGEHSTHWPPSRFKLTQVNRELPINAEDVSLLNSRIGSTVWQIQALEDTLAHFITIALKVTDRSKAMDEAEKVLGDVRGLTLGRLVGEIKTSIQLPEGFEESLKTFLDERNWLIHRIWRLHHTDIYHADRFSLLLKRIDKLADESKKFNHIFADMLERYVVSKGVSREFIDNEAEKTLKKWVNGKTRNEQ